MTSEKKFWVALVAVAIIAIGGWLYPTASTLLGGVSNYDEVDATAIKVGGTNGTRVGPIISTTCNLIQSSAGSHAATTTKEYFCAITGVSASDYVSAVLPQGAYAASYGGFGIAGAYATTTGFVGVQVINLTGTATSSFPLATTSVQVYVAHPVTSVPGL